MINCRVKLVLYPAGARGDFLCGWAGLLPTVINNWWSIDPITGFSQVTSQTKMLDHGSDLQEILKTQDLCLDINSDLFYVGGCHGYNIDLALLEPLVDSGTLELYAIDTSKVDQSVIAWEWLVKTYLSQRNTIFFEQTNRSWIIDSEIGLPCSEITNQHRIDAVTRKARQVTTRPIEKFLNSSTVTVLDYNELFVPGGSAYACDRLELKAPASCHEFWNHMLPFAHTPETLIVWGHEWNKKDFFN